jgi:phage tail-like protein
MASPSQESTVPPFIAFNFSVEIRVPGVVDRVCNAAFAECDGLEMTMEVKRIREGGNNAVHVVLPGPTAFGQLTLKRGMTSSFDLWDWFQAVQTTPSLRADTTVVMLAADASEQVRFLLARCIPVRLKAPALSARDGAVAIEELQVAYESLQVRPATGGA